MVAEYLRLVGKTTRFVVEPEGLLEEDFQQGLPLIVGFWHGQHYLMPFVRRGQRVTVLISRHRDGEVNAIAAERLGLETIRGSGDRGGEFARKGAIGAFRQMLRALAQGCSVALTADVPKVSRIAGPGIVRLAAASGRPIYLVSITTRNRVTLNSWDRSEINLPFGRGAIVGRGPFRVAADADSAALESTRELIEKELAAATARAHELADRPRGGVARV